LISPPPQSSAINSDSPASKLTKSKSNILYWCKVAIDMTDSLSPRVD
jgi:hypothetical protein